MIYQSGFGRSRLPEANCLLLKKGCRQAFLVQGGSQRQKQTTFTGPPRSSTTIRRTTASFFRRTGMARIQIITAVTLDGYLPDPNEELLQWVKTDSQGFPFWHERSTFTLFPGYPMLDLICEKDEKPDSFTFTSEISDPKSLDLLHGLSIYHLIDEIIIYILPLTTGNGTDCLHRLPVNRWKLYRTVAFKNGIVRLIYRKSSR